MLLLSVLTSQKSLPSWHCGILRELLCSPWAPCGSKGQMVVASEKWQQNLNPGLLTTSPFLFLLCITNPNTCDGQVNGDDGMDEWIKDWQRHNQSFSGNRFLQVTPNPYSGKVLAFMLPWCSTLTPCTWHMKGIFGEKEKLRTPNFYVLYQLLIISNMDASQKHKERYVNNPNVTIQRLPVLNILVNTHPFSVFFFSKLIYNFNTFILNQLFGNLFLSQMSSSNYEFIFC
jgi:hypothetical protein